MVSADDSLTKWELADVSLMLSATQKSNLTKHNLQHTERFGM